MISTVAFEFIVSSIIELSPSSLDPPIIAIEVLIAACPPFLQQQITDDPDILSRALLFLHEQGECVYFNDLSLRDIAVLDPQFLTLDVLGKLLEGFRDRPSLLGKVGIHSVSVLSEI